MTEGSLPLHPRPVVTYEDRKPTPIALGAALPGDDVVHVDELRRAGIDAGVRARSIGLRNQRRALRSSVDDASIVASNGPAVAKLDVSPLANSNRKRHPFGTTAEMGKNVTVASIG